MCAALSPYRDTVYSTGPLKDLRWRMALSRVFLNSEHCVSCLVVREMGVFLSVSGSTAALGVVTFQVSSL